MWVCGIHDNMLKASGVCVICLEPTTDSAARITLPCSHTYHKECLGHLEKACCPSCRAPIKDKYAKRIFTDTKVDPLANKVFSLGPEKQQAFFSIADTVADILRDIHDIDGSGHIMALKSFIATYKYGVKTLRRYGVGIMEDWSVAATTAFGHIREYDTYNGLSFNTNGDDFWVDTQPPQQQMIVVAPVVEPEYVPVQQNEDVVQMPRDPRIQPMQFVPVQQPLPNVVMFGQVAQLRPAQYGEDVFPPAPLDIDMEWDGLDNTPRNSPVSPSIISL
jgi:RING-like zinc finger